MANTTGIKAGQEAESTTGMKRCHLQRTSPNDTPQTTRDSSLLRATAIPSNSTGLEIRAQRTSLWWRLQTQTITEARAALFTCLLQTPVIPGNILRVKIRNYATHIVRYSVQSRLYWHQPSHWMDPVQLYLETVLQNSAILYNYSHFLVFVLHILALQPDYTLSNLFFDRRALSYCWIL